ncbi:hypothetical protein L6452_14997 [Arctium lappa]|uniref:Uncharacterized protein n=1 Tax=Arctium lappa TaxID=4217 RepID=A0ACB9CMU4_ARCLA|nr:hypothetical protein L6452_14997 [Arctium lappa]
MSPTIACSSSKTPHHHRLIDLFSPLHRLLHHHPLNHPNPTIFPRDRPPPTCLNLFGKIELEESSVTVTMGVGMKRLRMWWQWMVVSWWPKNPTTLVKICGHQLPEFNQWERSDTVSISSLESSSFQYCS